MPFGIEKADESKTGYMKYLGWIMAIAFLGCNNAPNKTKTTDAPTTADTLSTVGNNTPAKDTSAVTHCYLAVQDRDTIRLQLVVKDSLVTGRMQYDNYQVDGNIGTVQAAKRNGRISGHFTFFAEGMWSVREIIFEERNGQLLQASTNSMSYGKDTVRFSNPQNLTFEQDRPFTPVPCSTVQFPELPPRDVSPSF